VDCPTTSNFTARIELLPTTIFFSPLKVSIRGKKFEDNEEVIFEVNRCLRQRPAEWNREGIQALTSRWYRAIDSEGDYAEK
jgi:hypothetical protein